MKSSTALIVITLSLAAAGCRRDDIAYYTVPKESDAPNLSVPAAAPSSMPSPGTPAETAEEPKSSLPPGHPDISGAPGMDLGGAQAAGIAPSAGPENRVTWKTPKGWIEKPGSGFRYATFVVPGPDGRTGDLSVTVLDGDAGGLLSNINRWRDQIGLSALAEGDLGAQTERATLGGRPMTLVNFVSAEPMIDGKFKKRLRAALFAADGRTWFFKLTGDDALVAGADRSFRAFLASLKGL
ncbi:MAG TPA: hypothetical protein PK362_12270 [Elusimicrobiota bacterium]|nr:hypothetical protein [Elusimicrobiota bacterium]